MANASAPSRTRTRLFARPGPQRVHVQVPAASGFVPDAIAAFQVASLSSTVRRAAQHEKIGTNAAEPLVSSNPFDAPEPPRQTTLDFSLPAGTRFAAPRVSVAPVSVLGVLPKTEAAAPVRPLPTVVLAPRVTTLVSTPEFPASTLWAGPVSVRGSRANVRGVGQTRIRPRVVVTAAALALAGGALVMVAGLAISQAPSTNFGTFDRSHAARARPAHAAADLGGLFREFVREVMDEPVVLAEVSTSGGELVEVEPGFGVLEISTDADLHVWIDGGARGLVQGQGHFTLPVGEHTVEVRGPGLRNETVIAVADGEATELPFGEASDPRR